MKLLVTFLKVGGPFGALWLVGYLSRMKMGQQHSRYKPNAACMRKSIEVSRKIRIKSDHPSLPRQTFVIVDIVEIFQLSLSIHYNWK